MWGEILVKKNGSILIVEDRLQEKIGSFYDQLVKNGYDIEIGENFEKANELLENLLKSNKIDGIILDFSFPVSEEDQSVNIDGIPSGVKLLQDYLFKLNMRRIPVVINTTGDEEYKAKYLENMGLSMPVYNVNHETNPLAKPGAQMISEIMEMFDIRNNERRIKPDSKWFNKGGPFIRDANGNIIGYR